MSKSRINELAKEIIRHRSLYYNDHPAISDASFDLICNELKGLDPNHIALTAIGAPVDADSEWEKANHEIPMGSLDKVNTPEELTDWASGIFKPRNSVFITEKLDGLSLEIIYENGKLVKAITRGDGLIGENITRNVVRMSGVKTHLDSFTGSLRGEIILKRSKHKKHFPDLSNPRNAATGIAKRIDSEGSEYLDVLFYQVIGNTDKLSLEDFKSEYLQFKFIEDTFGLSTPVYEAFVGKDIDETCAFVNTRWEEYHTLREERDYDIDGLVIRINDLADQTELGDKDMRPKGAIAFKFRNESTKTILKGVICQTGNSGRITPVAEVETVQLMGANVSRASLYNFAYINELKLDIGAEVLICRANDVIPRIEETIRGTDSIFKAPRECPSCGGPTEMRGENLMCISTDLCPAQKVGRVKNWVGTLNILEWGDTLLERLVETGRVYTIVDLYKLSAKELSELERMGERSATKCYRILWSHNPVPLELFLGGLSIPMIGSSMIKMLIDAGCDTLDKILAADIDTLLKIKGLGPRKSESLVKGLKRNREIINGLLAAGLKIKEKIVGPLSGKSFCFTGTMANKRATLEDRVIQLGGQVKSVGRDLSYLVINDLASTTGKAVAARKLGTKLISEDEFLSMCK